MPRTVARAACLALALTITACASPPPHTEIPFDHAAAPDIKTIGVASPSFPPGPSAVLASSAATYAGGGLVGGLARMVAAGMQADREAAMAKLLADQNFDAKAVFTKSLQAAIESRGYHTVLVSPMRESPELFAAGDGFKGQPAADAYLDVVVVHYGYIASGLGDSRPYRPMIHLSCRLLSKDLKQVMMFDSVLVNPLGTPDDAVQVPPPADYAFVDTPSLSADPPRTVEGIQAAIDLSTDTIGKLVN